MHYAPQDLDRAVRPRTGPLTGLRVADFCWMGVGAMATRTLADFGATVIKIEDRTRLDLPRRTPVYKGTEPKAFGEEEMGADPNRSGFFNNLNRNKLGICLNMRLPRGRELAERLIATSSVVSENFSPGVMERWGLTYDRLRELVPNVIYARMSGFGHSGPDAHYRSYGPVVQAISGLTFISGLPHTEPSGWGLSYMDNQAGYYNACALLAAIYNRITTGRGTLIDASAVEIGVSLVGPLMLEVTVNGRRTRDEPFPTGNRLERPDAAPHGVYPCRGQDRWVAIAVFTDAEWDGLTEAIGSPPWATDPRFSTQARRFANQDTLDAYLSEWTQRHDRHDIMHLLQAHGVRAGAVQSAEDLVEHDPVIAARDAYFELDHPVAGSALFEGTPAAFSRFKQDNWRSAPMLGEDNEYVYKHLLGMEDDEYQDLLAEGVI